MKDYDVWYAGRIIGNLQAATPAKAKSKAKQTYSSGKMGTIVVTATDAAREETDKAKKDSAVTESTHSKATSILGSAEARGRKSAASKLSSVIR